MVFRGGVAAFLLRTVSDEAGSTLLPLNGLRNVLGQSHTRLALRSHVRGFFRAMLVDRRPEISDPLGKVAIVLVNAEEDWSF